MKTIIPEADIIQKYTTDKRSIISLSKEYNCGQGKINRILQKNNIHIRDRVQCQLKTTAYIPESEYKNIGKMFLLGKTKQEIAIHYNSTSGYIKSILAKNNIKRYQFIVKYPTIKRYKDDIIKRREQNISISNIAKHFGCSESVIIKVLDNNNIFRKRKISKLIYDINQIKQLYSEGKSTIMISKIYNCSSQCINKVMKDNGLKLRTSEQANKLYGGTPEFYAKWKQSAFRHKEYILPSGKIEYLMGYEPQFLDYVFKNKLLTEQEFNFSSLRIPYTYKREVHHYIPDFFIPKLNLIIEIKSTYIHKKQGIKLNKAKQRGTEHLGYNYLLILDNNFTKFTKIVVEMTK